MSSDVRPRLALPSGSIRRGALIVGAYLCLYVLLDVAGLAFRTDSLVSLWYLADGASLALLLVFGVRYAPAIVVTSLITSFLTYPSAAPAGALIVWSLLFPLPFVAATVILRSGLRIAIPPHRRRDVLALLAGCLALSVFLAGAFTLSVLVSSLSVPAIQADLAALPAMALRWWIGEAIGLVMVTPLLVITVIPWLTWRLSSSERRARPRKPVGFRLIAEGSAQVLSIAVALLVVFGMGRADRLPLLYLCFLPLIWITLRHGLHGATWAIAVIDTGAILAARLSGVSMVQIAELQVFILILALTGLAMGAVVDEQRTSEARKRQSEEEFRTMAESLPQMAWITRPDGWNTYFNQQWVDYTGMTLEESYGEGWIIPFHPDDRLRSQEAWERATATGTTYQVEVRLRRVDGAYRWWLIRGVPLRDPDGEIVKWFGTCTDIEELKQATIELEVSEGRLAAVAEQSRTIAWEVDPDGLYTYVSPVIEAVLGFRPDEVIGRLHFYDLHPEVGREAFKQTSLAVFSDGGSFKDLGNPAEAKDGGVLWLSTNGLPVTDVDGTLIGYRGSDTDITERKQAEEDRRRDFERVRGALSSTVEIVGQVSETRDPYTAGHQRRVSEIAVRISQEMGLTAEQSDEIRTAALLHDVGKMSVPTETLSKPGALSDIEWQLVKGHAEAGYRIISAAHMEGPTAEMVYQHHERCDGSGYPRGLGADALLLGAKVLMVADVVEAMMSHRPYRPTLGIDAALAEIERGAGTCYDADVCRACVAIFRDRGFSPSPSDWT